MKGSRRPDGTSPAKLLDGRPVMSQWFGQSSFSRISAVDEKCVVRCPSPDDLAIYSPMGCGYQTGAGTVLNVLKPEPHQTVAVFGAGSVGFAALMAAAALSVKQLIAVDIVEPKLALARELGATHTINSSAIEGSVIDKIKELTGGRGVDFAIDATGVPSVTEKMLDCLAFCGTAASVGVPPPTSKITVGLGAFVSGRKTWVSVTEGDSHPPEVCSALFISPEAGTLTDDEQFIPKLIELHKQGKFPVEKISRVYPVAELKKALSDMKDGTVRTELLVCIRPSRANSSRSSNQSLHSKGAPTSNVDVLLLMKRGVEVSDVYATSTTTSVDVGTIPRKHVTPFSILTTPVP